MSQFKLYLLVNTCLLSMTALAQPTQSIGRVLITQGLVQTIDTSGIERQISRRSEIFSGERIVTGPDSITQLRMVDGAMISLKPDTEFVFINYQFQNTPTSPRIAEMELVRGGFRTITGVIGENSQDIYTMVILGGVVTARGPNYNCVIENDASFCGVNSGGITVKNQIGSLNLGLGGDHDYMQLTVGNPPEGLLQEPAALEADYFTPISQSNSANTNNGGGNSFQSPTNGIVRSAQGPQIKPVPTNTNPAFPSPEPIRVAPYKNGTNQ